MVGRGHKQFFDIIIINGLHSFNSTSATVLTAEIVHCHSLDIAKLSHSNNRIFPWDQVLCGKIIYVISDCSSSLIAIFVSNCKNFFSYNTQKKISVCKDCQEFADFFL